MSRLFHSFLFCIVHLYYYTVDSQVLLAGSLSFISIDRLSGLYLVVIVWTEDYQNCSLLYCVPAVTESSLMSRTNGWTTTRLLSGTWVSLVSSVTELMHLPVSETRSTASWFVMPELLLLLIFVILFAVNAVCRCIHCQKLAPMWQQLAESFSNTEAVTIAEVDCSLHSHLCHEQGVS